MTSPCTCQKTIGFSLVELSIVLVILGLLVGGVLSGQSLIRAAELRSISSDFARYETAVQTFRDKYFALPGDMPNATQFWGAIDPNPTLCAGVPSNTLTCNGNGDGLLELAETESLRAWQHLSNATLIEGRYPGADLEGDNFSELGRDLPRSKIANAGFSFVTEFSYSYTGGVPNRQYISFGAINDDFGTGWGAIKPEEAWNIDTKMDDGRPGNGRLRANITSTAGCMSTTVASTSVYILTNTGNLCGIGWALF